MSNKDSSHTAYRRPHRSLKSKYNLSEALNQNETKSEVVVTRTSTAKNLLVWAVIFLMLFLLSSRQQQHEYNARNVSGGDVIVKRYRRRVRTMPMVKVACDQDVIVMQRSNHHLNHHVSSPILIHVTCQVLSSIRNTEI